MSLSKFAPRLIGLTLFSVGSLIFVTATALGHHRHHYPFHFATYPGATVPVYRCSPVSASAVQTVVANYNANGGIGTTLSYGGDSCSSSTGIIVKEDTTLGSGAGKFVRTGYSQREREILKDSAQLGRVFYDGNSGQWKLTGADAVTYNGTDKAVIAHEIGHGLGLHEHYVDVTGINNCSNGSVTTVMDCSGADSGPFAHDAADLSARWSTSPWGMGAVWITNDTGGGDTSITLNWADINDNETNHAVYKNGSFVQNANVDDQSANLTSMSTNDCFYIVVSNGVGTNTSSQICRNGPSQPAAPSGASASVTPNHYTALFSWTTNAADNAYTFEFITAYLGDEVKAQYYVPHHGTGAASHSITLGPYDPLPNTYTLEVTTCNAKYNPSNGLECDGAAAYASAYLYYP